MKKALVLGVGNAQVDLIKALKARGWWVIGCSYRHEGRGLQFVDQFELVNITDYPGVKTLAQAEKVDLIYSIGSDLAMPTLTRVAAELGLPVLVSHAVAELLQHKFLLRSFLAEHHLSPMRYARVRSLSDLEEWQTFPAIVKPVDNQGQRGVFLARTMQDVRNQFAESLAQSRSQTLIIEEYLDGLEVSVNAFVVDGEIVVSEISDRLVVEGYAGGIPDGHVFPSSWCDDHDCADIHTLACQCIQALGIQAGPVYFQIKLTSKGPRVVELTPRLDGCHMWRLIKMASGIDLLDACIRLLEGDRNLSFSKVPAPAAYHLKFFLRPPGQVFYTQDYPVDADRNASDFFYEYYYTDGETIRPVNGKLEKVGFYIERLPAAGSAQEHNLHSLGKTS
jgi:biotin carboxylase